MTKDAPVDEVADKARQACNSVALNLIESHLDMLCGDLCGSVVQGVTEMLLARNPWFRTTLALRSSQIHICYGGLRTFSNQVRQINVTLAADPARAETWQSIVTSADGSSHIDLVLRVALGELFVARMRNDLHREVLDELSEVASDVCNGYV